QVMSDPSARTRYLQKRVWQHLQRWPCGLVAVACRNEPAFYRSRATGAWTQKGGDYQSAPVGYVEEPDSSTVSNYVAAAREFIPQLGVAAGCVILAAVPTAKTPSGTARMVAAELGLPLIAPQPDSLTTYDGSHLNRPSAERWSQAFLDRAGPQILNCLKH